MTEEEKLAEEKFMAECLDEWAMSGDDTLGALDRIIEYHRDEVMRLHEDEMKASK